MQRQTILKATVIVALSASAWYAGRWSRAPVKAADPPEQCAVLPQTCQEGERVDLTHWTNPTMLMQKPTDQGESRFSGSMKFTPLAEYKCHGGVWTITERSR